MYNYVDALAVQSCETTCSVPRNVTTIELVSAWFTGSIPANSTHVSISRALIDDQWDLAVRVELLVCSSTLLERLNATSFARYVIVNSVPPAFHLTRFWTASRMCVTNDDVEGVLFLHTPYVLCFVAEVVVLVIFFVVAFVCLTRRSCRSSVVRIATFNPNGEPSGHGSGVLLAPGNAIILTAAHVVMWDSALSCERESLPPFKVTFMDGTTYMRSPEKIVFREDIEYHPTLDLAILHVPRTVIPSACQGLAFFPWSLLPTSFSTTATWMRLYGYPDDRVERCLDSTVRIHKRSDIPSVFNNLLRPCYESTGFQLGGMSGGPATARFVGREWMEAMVVQGDDRCSNKYKYQLPRDKILSFVQKYVGNRRDVEYRSRLRRAAVRNVCCELAAVSLFGMLLLHATCSLIVFIDDSHSAAPSYRAGGVGLLRMIYAIPLSIAILFSGLYCQETLILNKPSDVEEEYKKFL